MLGAAAAEEDSTLDSWYVDDAIPPNTAAAIALIEHRWALPLREKIRAANGFHLADAWIHPADLVAIGMLAAEEADRFLEAAPARRHGRHAAHPGRHVPDGLRATSIRRSGPSTRSTVDGFWMDEHPVTAAEFRRFVRATGYVTVAERPLDPADYPDADPSCSCPARSSSARRAGPVDLRDVPQLVGVRAGRLLEAARRARAARSTAATATRSCTSPTRTPRPTRPGPARSCRPKPSGSSRRAAASTGRPSPGATRTRPSGKPMANTWQGEFPWQNLTLDGYEGTSPVGSSRRTATGSRHGRQRLGMDERLLHAPVPSPAAHAARPNNPRVGSPDAASASAQPALASRAR